MDPNFPMPLWNLGGSSASAGVTASPRLALLSESERTDRSEEETRETLGDQIKEKVMMSPICFGEQCDEGSKAGRTVRSGVIPGIRLNQRQSEPSTDGWLDVSSLISNLLCSKQILFMRTKTIVKLAKT